MPLLVSVLFDEGSNALAIRSCGVFKGGLHGARNDHPFATRTPEKHGLKGLDRFITFGASPRATIGLVEGARALAMLRGRNYVLPEDMSDLVPDVLRHRIVLSYEGLSEGLDSDALIARIMDAVTPPAKPLEHDKKAA